MINKIYFIGLCLLCWVCVWAGIGWSSEQFAPYETHNSFTIIQLPSSHHNQDILACQMKWIAENVNKMKTVLVIHTGDMVQKNTEQEWIRIDKSLRRLDGVVPYLVAAGNHESFVKEGKHRGKRDTTIFNKHIPVSRFSDKTWYGGHFESGSENMFFLLNIQGVKFLFLSIEFAPRDKVLDWANKAVSEHKDCRTIVVTHSYTYSGESRINFKLNPLKYDQNNTDRDEMWERFVSKHRNIFLVLSAHYFGVRRETSIGNNGNRVHQVMASYLDDEHKLQGWLRIIRFLPEQGSIRFRTYSPVLNKSLTDEQNQFEFKYEMK